MHIQQIQQSFKHYIPYCIFYHHIGVLPYLKNKINKNQFIRNF